MLINIVTYFFVPYAWSQPSVLVGDANEGTDTWLMEGLAEQSSYEMYGQSAIEDRFDRFNQSNFNKNISMILVMQS